MFKREIGKLVWDGKRKHTPRRFLMCNKYFNKGRKKLMNDVIFYDDGHVFEPLKAKYLTRTFIIENDTFSMASGVENSCCLNFASYKNPGGGYKGPAQAQEEDLFRRSNLPALLDNETMLEYYPITGLKGFYCPKVVVNKDTDLEDIEPFETSVITLAAVKNPQPGEEQLMKDKIERVFKIAADNDVENLILGSWGSGAYNCSPVFMAKSFKEYLEKCDGVFKTVIFAIPDRESKNYKVYEQFFCG